MPKVIHVPAIDTWDEENYRFITYKATDIVIEHSLISLSKWESKWKISFLSTPDKTPEQIFDYIKFMIIGKYPGDEWLNNIPEKSFNEILDYIKDPMTATKIKEKNGSKLGSIITNEVLYALMASYQIPFEICEKWHINRLITLLRVCEEKSQPPKKMSKKDIYAQNRALNEARKAKYHTHG